MYVVSHSQITLFFSLILGAGGKSGLAMWDWGQKQMDYRFQPGFDCLENEFDFHTKMASKIVDFCSK